ncbi:MAG: AAA family ATPase [Ardenticatenaceae bacterium]
MAVKKFQFVDKARKWTLKESAFSDFNLLVGVSGVGKTRILDALRSVRQAGISDTREVNGCQWTLELVYEGMKFSWSAEISLLTAKARALFLGSDEQHERHDPQMPHFVRERIVRDDQTVLVDRTLDKFQFGNISLPKLKNTESAITLLADEERIAPLNRALRQLMFSSSPYESAILLRDPAELGHILKQYQTLDSLREAAALPILLKAYVLQQNHPQAFQRIQDHYCDIFDTVYELKLAKLVDLDPSFLHNGSAPATNYLTVGLKEQGVEGWITNDISSGMRRTLIHLMELSLAPAGSVIAIDEIENSLGVNCLDQIVEQMLRRSKDVQFILTSHHPYVINNVPSKYWKIVTRQGSIVTVLAHTGDSHGDFL